MKISKNHLLAFLLIINTAFFSSCNDDDKTETSETSETENNIVNSVSSNSDYQKVLELVNKARKEEGANPLILNNELVIASFNHSEDMLNQDYFSHSGKNGSSFSERARNANYDGSPMGENIAKGQRSPESVVNTWLTSSGHRRNMLNPKATEMGIGRSTEGNYWTQIMGRR